MCIEEILSQINRQYQYLTCERLNDTYFFFSRLCVLKMIIRLKRVQFLLSDFN